LVTRRPKNGEKVKLRSRGGWTTQSKNLRFGKAKGKVDGGAPEMTKRLDFEAEKLKENRGDERGEDQGEVPGGGR